MDAEETKLYHALIIAGLILGVIICYFLFFIARYQKKYRLLSRAHIEEEFKLIEAERQRIAYDLHDDLGPYLSAAALKIQIMDARGADEEALQQECLENIGTVIGKLSEIATSLLPYSLKSAGPIAAIEDFIKKLKSARLKVELLYTELPTFTDIQCVHIYRLLQEIIHNSLKHARAGRLKISMETTKQSFIIKSADDGWEKAVPAGKQKGKGLGMEIMAGRVMQLDGEMNVDMHPKLGTRYQIVIPLFPKQKQ